jgi:hypothetical protein
MKARCLALMRLCEAVELLGTIIATSGLRDCLEHHAKRTKRSQEPRAHNGVMAMFVEVVVEKEGVVPRGLTVSRTAASACTGTTSFPAH